jgi:hypothetical protein
MPSITLAFPVKRGTIAGVKKWASGAPSKDGSHSVLHYKCVLEQLGVVRQDWYFQMTPAGDEIITVYTEADDPERVRSSFLGVFTGIQSWCKTQLRDQGAAATADVFSATEVLHVYP